MTEFDIANIYDEVQLRRTIDGLKDERDFWFDMVNRFPEHDCKTYYHDQYNRYNERLRDLRNMLKEKFGAD